MTKETPPCTCTELEMCYKCQFSALAAYESCVVCRSWLGEEILPASADFLCGYCQHELVVLCRGCGELFVPAEVSTQMQDGCCIRCKDL